jgi:hypothetical protein
VQNGSGCPGVNGRGRALKFSTSTSMNAGIRKTSRGVIRNIFGSRYFDFVWMPACGKNVDKSPIYYGY